MVISGLKSMIEGKILGISATTRKPIESLSKLKDWNELA